ncbi:hypothetical protein CH063_15749 [Colletotrichum higginsianum]|uniref:Uncharacterized protein n=1 Tax=Colletotrichum higginsianum (strain IMI 349063) TaxID=759273 RepID=H1W497_COLHI|nr:hypothetical protein CH063_15749 [Colletotrichum higginsianum]
MKNKPSLCQDPTAAGRMCTLSEGKGKRQVSKKESEDEDEDGEEDEEEDSNDIHPSGCQRLRLRLMLCSALLCSAPHSIKRQPGATGTPDKNTTTRPSNPCTRDRDTG